ncbi:MAG: 2-hydroxyisobutanoyl-CoA mutase large subunit [Trebonia sp.]|jgi:methylmalonyl-CoA mutase cobalamin-binding domain/chain|nr:methylmalonyl-CoA mutase [Actinomycetes bacterium]MDX6421980.1 2-hydroxyisobutanoyl-CoA mutase large subunit [Trebonia sp.]
MDDTAAEARKPAEDEASRVEAQVRHWEDNELAKFLAKRPETKEQYFSGSGAPVQRVYTPADIADVPFEEIGLPGQYPFTRGPYPTMYRGRPWTMRQIAGFGTPAETNQRFQYLIAQGQTGLSVDFDMPTLMGYDSDDAMSLGEVGREGVAVDVLEDMDKLFEGINLEEISVSMTINPSAWILLAMYIAVARRRGYDLNKLSGTIQNDILKEYIAQKEWIYPPEPSMRIVRDTITYTATRMARYNPINISGYHTSEAGASALQEIAFTIAAAREYVRTVVATGMDVDTFAPRLSFFFVCQADFFEEIAKFRAARRYYARMMKEEFGASNPDSMRMRFHTQTAAATLTKPQPYINIVRTAIQALAAVLGGTQSLHTNGLDEAYTIPSEFAMKLALRTQQIIAEETNVTQVIDPLGGSYYIERLTADMEADIRRYLDTIDELGGTLACIESNYFQKEIADFAYEFAQRKAGGDRTVIGVNKFVDAAEEQQIEVHRLDPDSERRKISRLKEVKESRDQAAVEATLAELKRVAALPDENIMPATIAAVEANVSMGEIVKALETVFGRYTERPVF